jgi:hypothetical protein
LLRKQRGGPKGGDVAKRREDEERLRLRRGRGVEKEKISVTTREELARKRSLDTSGRR